MTTAVEKIEKKQHQSVVKSAIYFAFGTFVSRILGLVRDSLLVAVFGLTINDAYQLAFRFPNLFRRIFGEGALSSSFIPLYIEYKEKGDRESLGQLTAGVLGLLLLTLLPFSIFVSFSTDWIFDMWLGAGRFNEVPGKMEMTVFMARIMFPFLILVSMYAYVMALLNVNKKFMLSSLASAMLNVAMIGACYWCRWTGNLSPAILAWSVILGGFLQFIILIPSLRGLNIPFKMAWSSITSEPVRRTLRAFLPSVLGLGTIQFMAFINGQFASGLAEGSVTQISLADRLLELPLSLIAVSLGTALLPSLSEKISDAKMFKQEIVDHIQLLLFLCIPSAVGMWMTCDLLVPVLFKHGAYTADQAAMVAEIVKVYCFTMISASLIRVVGQAFYAHKDTRLPTAAAIFGLAVHLVLAPILMARFQVIGLVTSTAIASFLNCLFLFGALRFKHGPLPYGQLALFISKSVVACTTIYLSCVVVQYLLPAPTFWLKIISLSICISLSCVTYFTFCHILKIKETHWLVNKLKRRIKRA